MGIGTTLGLQATLLHLFNHALMKGALFLALAAVVYRIGSVDISAFRGLGKTMPLTMAAIVGGGLSLIGVPLTVGFVSKWHLILAAFNADLWFVGLLVVIGSILALYYVWGIIEAAYFCDPEPGTSNTEAGLLRREAPLSLLIPTWILIGANIYFGIDTRLTVDISAQIARYLMAGGQ